MTDDSATTIRVSSLLGRSVIDESGRHHGHVIDVRAVQDGAATDGMKAALRVDGLVVGTGGIGERLGLLRHRVHGPWLLVVLARLIGRDCRYVLWTDLRALPGVDPGDPVRITTPPGGTLRPREDG
jgi:hypothetical protein